MDKRSNGQEVQRIRGPRDKRSSGQRSSRQRFSKRRFNIITQEVSYYKGYGKLLGVDCKRGFWKQEYG